MCSFFNSQVFVVQNNGMFLLCANFIAYFLDQCQTSFPHFSAPYTPPYDYQTQARCTIYTKLR